MKFKDENENRNKKALRLAYRTRQKKHAPLPQFPVKRSRRPQHHITQ